MERDKPAYTNIPDKLYLKLVRTNFSAYENRVLWVILKKTVGWNKASDWITYKQFIEITGIKKGNVWSALNSLKKRNIIYKNGNELGVNKYFEDWDRVLSLKDPKGSSEKRLGVLSRAEVGSPPDRNPQTNLKLNLQNKAFSKKKEEKRRKNFKKHLHKFIKGVKKIEVNKNGI